VRLEKKTVRESDLSVRGRGLGKRDHGTKTRKRAKTTRQGTGNQIEMSLGAIQLPYLGGEQLDTMKKNWGEKGAKKGLRCSQKGKALRRGNRAITDKRFRGVDVGRGEGHVERGAMTGERCNFGHWRNRIRRGRNSMEGDRSIIQCLELSEGNWRSRGETRPEMDMEDFPEKLGGPGEG